METTDDHQMYDEIRSCAFVISYAFLLYYFEINTLVTTC